MDWVYLHDIISMSKEGMEDMITKNPSKVIAVCRKAYDKLPFIFSKLPDINADNKVQQVKKTIQFSCQSVGLEPIELGKPALKKYKTNRTRRKNYDTEKDNEETRNKKKKSKKLRRKKKKKNVKRRKDESSSSDIDSKMKSKDSNSDDNTYDSDEDEEPLIYQGKGIREDYIAFRKSLTRRFLNFFTRTQMGLQRNPKVLMDKSGQMNCEQPAKEVE